MVNKLNQVLIVTCNRDRWQFQIQCWSIGKYLEPCDLHIVINELDPTDWPEWFAANCRLYLNNHNVKVWTYEDFMDDIFLFHPNMTKGWLSQQLFKLAFACKTQDPYIILDSKNWFVKNTKLSDLPKRPRETLSTIPDFNKFIYACLEKFNLSYVYCRGLITPYHFTPGIVLKMFEHFGGQDAFNNWFLEFSAPSEFIVYDLFAQYAKLDSDAGTLVDNYRYFWYTDLVLDLEKFKLAVIEPGVKMVSVHSPLLKTIDPQAIESVLKDN